MARRVLMVEVSKGQSAVTEQTDVRLDGLCDGFLGSRGMTVEAARQCLKDRKKFRALVHM